MENKKVILISFLLGIIFTLFFYNKQIGISFPIYMVLLICSLIYFLKELKIHVNSKHYLFVIPIILLSLRLFLSTNMIINFFNVLIIIIIYSTMNILLVSKQTKNYINFKLCNEIVDTIFSPITYFHKLYSSIYKQLNFIKNEHLKKIFAKVFLGIVISFPLVIIVLILLSSADLMFANLFSSSKLDIIFSHIKIMPIILSIFIATYLWSYLFYLIERQEKISNNEINTIKKQKNNIDSITLITILGIFNVIYIIFSIIQIIYLFNGTQRTLLDGITYSDYARQGFIQLVIVTFINFALIFYSMRNINLPEKITNFIIKTLSILMSISTYLMIYSAYYRMHLYEQQYGYTYLRVFVYFFLFVESICLLEMIYYILKPNFSITKVCIITFLGSYIALNYINIDEMIAKKNIDRYFSINNSKTENNFKEEDSYIDLYYITSLSTDSISQTIRLLKSKDEIIRNSIYDHLKSEKNRLDRNNEWQEFNYSEYKAKKILDNLVTEK